MPKPDDLYASAVLFWPKALVEREASVSTIPLLLETQDQFISLLNISDAAPDAWQKALTASKSLSANLFLKHLMVISDVGGELLQRLRTELAKAFPKGVMTFGWKGQPHSYCFKAVLTQKRLDNKTLAVDGPSLVHPRQLTDVMVDVAMLLLHGAASVDPLVPAPIKEKCVVGGLMGQKQELVTFVKQRYILVSRITQGARSNTLGQLAQDLVKETLEGLLEGWKFTRNGTIPGISQTGGLTDIGFDIVARSPKGRYVAIEVTFQVTTNSVIERKAGQAEARAKVLHAAGHRIAYVIDGAGNFQRQAALRTICQFSDCAVTIREDELAKLAQFLRAADDSAATKSKPGRN
jgi:hypothetical protein